MKQLIISIILFLFLASCGTSQEVSQAKETLLTPWEQPEETIVVEEQAIVENKPALTHPVEIVSLTSENPLTFDEISPDVLNTWEVRITWTTDGSVEKIQVLFSNPTSSYPDDDYTLKEFVSWWDTFVYNASSRNQVLDYGENTYIFRAYTPGEVAETKIILRIPEKNITSEPKGREDQLVGTEDNTVFLSLPTSSYYGEPIRLGEESFTYTQVKWFEAKKELLPEVTCETLTEYLTENINTWYYWNTCREIDDGKWLSFNLIYLDGDTYIYERNYFDFVHWLYATYELQRGTWVSSENIAEKNDELKQMDFPNEQIVDSLVNDIIES